MVKPEDVVLEEIDRVMDDFIDEVFKNSQELLIDQGKVDTSNLLKSGNINREFLKKEIIYSAPYADVIEFGRVPGTMPPVDPIIGWVRRKLGVRSEAQARSIAFAIARAIKARGQDPAPYIMPAFIAAKNKFNL